MHPETCTVITPTTRSTADIVASAPPGTRAMFLITTGPDDYTVGEHVVFEGQHAKLCMTGERVSVKGCSLTFVSYIDEKQC